MNNPCKNCIEFDKNYWAYLGPFKLIRNFGNKLGLAWWAKVDTVTPNATYWYGPFLTKRSLRENLDPFIDDLKAEKATGIKHSIVRCKKEEPLTV